MSITHTVTIQYFKQSGKYYSEDILEVEEGQSWQDIVSELRISHGTQPMPGLSSDGGQFYVYINSPDHPDSYPSLLLPKKV